MRDRCVGAARLSSSELTCPPWSADAPVAEGSAMGVGRIVGAAESGAKTLGALIRVMPGQSPTRSECLLSGRKDER